MARYFFDTDSGEPIIDDEGIDTLAPGIVPGTALQLLSQMMAYGAFASGQMLSVTVRDASDLVVFRVVLTIVSGVTGG